MRPWPLLLVAACLACGPREAGPLPETPTPSGIEITYLEPIPDHSPPTLRGKICNRTWTAVRRIEFDLFYGPETERELDRLVIRDIPAGGFREFDVPLAKVDRNPTTWRTRFVRVEWAEGWGAR